MAKTTVQVKTKLDKNDKTPKITALVLDWDGVTAEMLQPVATDGFVINLQGKWRRAKSVPPKLEVKVSELIAGMGSRQIPATVDGLAAVASTMKPEEVEALIAKMREESKARAAAEKAQAKPATGKGGSKPKPAAGGDGQQQPNAQ